VTLTGEGFSKNNREGRAICDMVRCLTKNNRQGRAICDMVRCLTKNNRQERAICDMVRCLTKNNLWRVSYLRYDVVLGVF
jgi:hypothetical protein